MAAVVSPGPPVMVVSGGVVSMVNAHLAGDGSVLAPWTALTSKT